ncbi:MAG: hypothetical protein WCO56_01315 [Verrucomicrobiota bacterium]
MVVIRLFTITMVGWWLAAFACPAAEMIPADIEKLSTNAQLVVQGRALSLTIQRNPAGVIYTAVDFQVDDVWRGQLGTNHIEIRYAGGILGEQGLYVTSEVEFNVGEEAVVFLLQAPENAWVCVGMSQGKFEVQPGPDKAQKLVHNPFHGQGQELLPISSLSKGTVALPASSPLTVGDLKKSVQEAK